MFCALPSNQCSAKSHNGFLHERRSKSQFLQASVNYISWLLFAFVSLTKFGMAAWNRKGNNRSPPQEMSLLKGPQGKLVMTIQRSSHASSTVRVKCIGQSKFTSMVLPRSACPSIHIALRS